MADERFAFIGTLTGPHSPANWTPNVRHHALFPGHAESSTVFTPNGKTYFPVMTERALWVEIWWRVKTMGVHFDFEFGDFAEVDDGVLQLADYSEPRTRVRTVNNKWSATADYTTDPFEPKIITFFVEVMGPAEPCYYWRTDFDPPKMLPRLNIYGTVTNASSSADYGSGPFTGTETDHYFETTLTFFGLTIPIWVNPTVALDHLTLSFDGEEWWQYLDSNGLPTYDSSTGAKLRPSYPTFRSL